MTSSKSARTDSKFSPPVFAVPGHPDNTITLTVGRGRSRAGRVGSGFGYNAYAVRSSDAPLFVTGANLRKTGDVYEFAITKSHYIDHALGLARRRWQRNALNRRQ